MKRKYRRIGRRERAIWGKKYKSSIIPDWVNAAIIFFVVRVCFLKTLIPVRITTSQTRQNCENKFDLLHFTSIIEVTIEEFFSDKKCFARNIISSYNNEQGNTVVLRLICIKYVKRTNSLKFSVERLKSISDQVAIISPKKFKEELKG